MSEHGPLVIEVIGGAQDGLRLSCAADEVHIGRAKAPRGAPANDLVLSKDSYSSSSHARLYAENGQWFLKDRNSTNHSQIRGNVLTEESDPELLDKHGFFILGNTPFEYWTEPRSVPTAPEASTPSPTTAARRMVERARAEAAKMRSTFLGAEHLFCALANSDASVLPDFFDLAKLDPVEVARQTLEYDRWTGDEAWLDKALRPVGKPASVDPKDLTETPRVELIWRLAEGAREQSGSPGVEPMHLLIGLLLEGGGTPTQVLREMGQDCQKLAVMAARLAKAAVAGEEDLEDEAEAKTEKKKAEPKAPEAKEAEAPERAEPKRPVRRAVDHNAWLTARELSDQLMATQVQYQLADPGSRLETLKDQVRAAFAKLAQTKREAVCEQLRLMFPLAIDQFEAPEWPDAEESLTEVDMATPTPAAVSGAGDRATGSRIRESTEVRARDADEKNALMKEIFESRQVVGDEKSDSEFLRLTRLFYEFALDMEQLTAGVYTTMSGGGSSDDSRIILPFARQDLKMMIEALMRDGDPKSVDEMGVYLGQLKQWQIALLSAFEQAADQWNQEIWETVNPEAIKMASNVSKAKMALGRGIPEFWQTFERRARNLHPEVSGGKFHDMVNKLTREEFREMGRRSGNGG